MGKERKLCRTCGKLKELSEYGINNSSKDGLNYKCKPCVREYKRRYNNGEIYVDRKVHCSKSLKRKKLIDSSSDGTITKSLITKMKKETKVCLYCGSEIEYKDSNIDHIQPLSKGGEHSIKNIIVCCELCNNVKQSATFDMWMLCIPDKQIKPLISHLLHKT